MDTIYHVTGSFLAQSTQRIVVYDDAGDVVEHEAFPQVLVANSEGTIAFDLELPAGMPPGCYAINAILSGQSTSAYAPARFCARRDGRSLSVAPHDGEAGVKFEFAGFGYDPGERVDYGVFNRGGGAIAIDSVTADGGGRIDFSIDSSGLAAGNYLTYIRSADETRGIVASAGLSIRSPRLPKVPFTATAQRFGRARGGLLVEPFPGERTEDGTVWNGSYERGTTVTIRAIPNSATRFESWTVNGVSKGSANPVTLVVEGDTKVVGTFSPLYRARAVAVSQSHQVFGGGIPGDALYAIGTDSTISRFEPETGWTSLGGGAIQLTVATTRRRTIELFAIDPAGRVMHSRKDRDALGWTGWMDFSGPVYVSSSPPTPVRFLTSHATGDGRVATVAVGADGHAWYAVHGDYVGDSVGWTDISGTSAVAIRLPVAVKKIALSEYPGGDLAAVALDEFGRLWIAWQDAVGGNWNGWATISLYGGFGEPASDVAAAPNGAGLSVFAINSSGEVKHLWQGADRVWRGWANLSRQDQPPRGAPTPLKRLSATSYYGAISLFAADEGGDIWYTRQEDRQGPWIARWEPLGGDAKDFAVIRRTSFSGSQLVVVGGNNGVWTRMHGWGDDPVWRSWTELAAVS